MIETYVIDEGILLTKVDCDYKNYNTVYDKKYGYCDVAQYYVPTKDIELERVLSDAEDFVLEGNNKAYAIVSKIDLPDDFDFEDGIVHDDMFTIKNIIYSAVKVDGELVEDFLNKSLGIEKEDPDKEEDREL